MKKVTMATYLFSEHDWAMVSDYVVLKTKLCFVNRQVRDLLLATT